MNKNIKLLPLSEKDIEKIKSLKSNWGVKTDESEIDKIVYGVER